MSRFSSRIIYGAFAIALLGAQARHHASAPAGNTMTVIAPANYTKYSYRGRPDLGLDVAIIQAGGGVGRFDTNRLLHVLAGSKAGAEAARLEKQYGKVRVAAFVETMNYAMNALPRYFAYNGIRLPKNPSVSPSDGRAIATAIYHDGIMLDGRYDCGYMMEHLMTHPIHIALMHQIDNAHAFGPSHNANFHVILTRAIVDLKNLYQPPSRTASI